MQPARNFVGVGVELSAGVQLGHDDFRRRHAFLGVHVHRNAAAVVDYTKRIVFADGDIDFGAESGQRLVDSVVHDLVDQVVQTHFAGGSDVHRRAEAHGLQT